MKIKISLLTYFLGTKPFDSIPYSSETTISANALFCLLKDRPEYCDHMQTHSLLTGDLVWIQELLLKMVEEVNA